MRLRTCDVCGKAADEDALCERCRAILEHRAELPADDPTTPVEDTPLPEWPDAAQPGSQGGAS